MPSSLLPTYRNPLIAGSCLTQTESVPATLVFTTQPGPDGTTVGQPLGQQPVVEVRDQNGAVITSYTGMVHMEDVTNAASPGGTVNVACVAGVATFTNLVPNFTGNITFGATISEIPSTFNSEPFLVLPSFALRLQTHSGNNVPLGLFQDVACTIPATQDGDPIKGWKGELMGVPVTATQSDDQKAPMLLFVDGVPTVFFDGVDDELSTPSAVPTEDSTTFAVFSVAADPSPFRRVMEIGNNNNVVLCGSNNADQMWYQCGAAGPIIYGPSGISYDAFYLASLRQTSALADFHWNGSSVGTVVPGPISTSSTPIFIGSDSGGGSVLNGSLIAILYAHSALSNGDWSTVETYLPTLKP